MSALTRKTSLVFGSASGLDQIEQFGSLAAGSPNYSTDPAVIQALSAWLEGWFGGVVGSNLPAIEDMNAFCFVSSYQLAYIFQEGIPEWDSATEYRIGSFVKVSGIVYSSIQNTNINHLVSDTAWWTPKFQPATQVFTTSGVFTAPPGVSRVAVILDFDTVNPMIEDFVCQNFSMIGAGFADYNQSLWGWGQNIQGTLGTGNNTSTSSPVQTLIGFGNKVRKLAMYDQENSGFVDTLGNLWSWGFNNHGQVGNGSVAANSSPVVVASSAKFKSIVNGSWSDLSAMALDVSGQLWAWGFNANGQLGIGSVTAKSTPTLVLGGINWAYGAITVNSFHCGIDVNGVGYAWGNNNNGQLGVGDVNPRSSPVAILGSITWKQLIPISLTGNAMLGLDTSGNAWGWGDGANGNLGTGTSIAYSSPIQVVGGHNFVTLIKGDVLSF